MTILAIETSCDETAVAILRDQSLLANEVASQVSQHAKFGGVVPEIAARNHVAQLPRLIERAIEAAKIRLDEIDAFAATSGPGLASSLLVGSSAAKGLAIGRNKPFLAINHLEGHLLSPFFGRDKIEPNVALIVSGGHTLLVNVHGVGEYEILGRTLDDAAGEAFDKVAKLLGLGYPGGPEIEERAKNGDPARFDLPRSMLDSGDLNFSFSGLKTAVRYLLKDLACEQMSRVGWASRPPSDASCVAAFRETRELRSGETPEPDELPTLISKAPASCAGKMPTLPEALAPLSGVGDICASFQQAVIDVLREKSLRAARETELQMLTMSGGVSCNEALRENLRAVCENSGIRFRVAEPWLCTDNGAMIAFAAMLRFRNGMLSDLIEEIDPNLALA